MSDDQEHVKRGRGRPKGTAGIKHRSKESRQLVRIMAAEQVPPERIAAALDITLAQLTKQYARELTTTKDLLNAEVIAKLFQTAMMAKERDAFRAQEFWVRCNAGWHEYSPKPWQQPKPADEPKPEKAEKLGKKEQANVDAQEVPQDGGWAGLVH